MKNRQRFLFDWTSLSSFLEKTTSLSQLRPFHDEFFDTKDHLLIQRNFWLKNQNGFWSVKICKSASDFEEFFGFEALKKVAETFSFSMPVDRASQTAWVRGNGLVPFASFSYERLFVLLPDRGLITIDCADFEGDGFYLIGSITPENPETKIPEIEGLPKAQSKVVEFLRHRSPKIYRKLGNFVLPINKSKPKLLDQSLMHKDRFPIAINPFVSSETQIQVQNIKKIKNQKIKQKKKTTVLPSHSSD